MQKIFPGLVFWFALALSVSGAEIKIDFSSFAAGSSPTNFHSAVAGGGQPGAWKIVMDEVPSAFTSLTPQQAPVVNRQAVVAQTSTDATDEHFPLFIYDGETFKDFKLSTRFKIVGGTAEQMAGLVFRFQNASNFYVVRASALGHNVRFYKMVDGIRTDPIGPALDITTNAWHTLALQCLGNQITFWLDDSQVMPALQDSTFAEGKIGYWTKSDAVSYFCGTVIDYTPRIPAAQALVNSTLEKEPRILGLQLYTLDAAGQPHIIASKDTKDLGQPGDVAEKTAITGGKVSFGKEKGANVVVMPLRDRNGDPMAAVCLRLKPFIGEIQAIAISRATTIVKLMESEITSSEDLLK
jgi:hypothetical protein